MRPIRIDRVSRHLMLCAVLVAIAMLYLLAADSLTDHEPPTFDCDVGDLLVIHPDDSVECVDPRTLP